jgi:hypothetical protein
MSDLRSDLEAELGQVAVDLDAAREAIVSRSLRAKLRRRALAAGAVAVVVALVLGVVTLSSRSDENSNVTVGPVDTTVPSGVVAPEGISAEVVDAFEVVDPSSGSQRLVVELWVQNDSAYQVLGHITAVYSGEATMAQNGVELAHTSFGDNSSRTSIINPGLAQCWTQSYSGLMVDDRTNPLTVTIPTASLTQENASGAIIGVIKAEFDPKIIRSVSATEYQTPSRSPNCG